jgi:hypothetical protein
MSRGSHRIVTQPGPPSVTVCGEPGALSLMWSAAVRPPAPLALKVIVI